MENSEVVFQYEQQQIIIQCQRNEKMKEISDKFANKVGSNTNNFLFLYGGHQLDFDLTFEEQSNTEDKNRNKMNVIVSSKNEQNIEVVQNNSNNVNNENNIIIPNYINDSNIKSKDVICPDCKENCRISIVDYKIICYDCRNGHKTNNIFLNDFPNTQLINEGNIICSNCEEKNKYESYNRKFFKCLSCGQNLCQICNQIHNKEHTTIDYDNKNYICKNHNDFYISLCKKCKINLCMNCFPTHKQSHEMIEYKNIIPNEEKIKGEMKELRENIDLFKKDIADIIGKLEKVKETIEIFYQINNDILQNYNVRNKNYQILQNVNDISNNIKMANIQKIINNKDIFYKFKEILKIYDKMFSKDENHDLITDLNIIEEDEEIEIEKEMNGKKTYNARAQTGRKSMNNLSVNLNFNKEKKAKQTKEIKKSVNNDKIKKYDKSKTIMKKNEEGNKTIKRNKTLSDKEIKSNLKKKGDAIIKTEEEEIEQLIKDYENKNGKFDENELLIIYRLDNAKSSPNGLKLFGEQFVSNNSENCTIMLDNKIMKLKSSIGIPQDYKNKKLLLIKFKGFNLTNMSHMFYKCTSLLYLSKNSTLNTSKVTNMSNLFYDCNSLKSLSCITEWDTSNVTDMSYMFQGCVSLNSLPDISDWNTEKVINMEHMFEFCNSLTSLPDISDWNTSNVKYMNDMFNSCSSLEKMSDISEWNVSNVDNFNGMFKFCSKLKSLPEIEKWNISNSCFTYGMFVECSKTLKIPQKFKK